LKIYTKTEETDIESTNRKTPIQCALIQNYPNPFNQSTIISYSVPNSDFVTLKIYDSIGREIQTLVSQNQKADTYIFSYDASKLSSGIYFYKLNVGTNFEETRKMLLMR
jgi:hypothetical protein